MATLRGIRPTNDPFELIRFFLVTLVLTAAVTFIVGSALLQRG